MSWQPFEIQGFMPDLPFTTPGAVFEAASLTGLYSYGLYPTASGLHNGPWPEITSSIGGTAGAIDTVSLGARVLYQPAGTYRIFIGTAAKIWEFNGGTTITDRSGGSMLASATASWSFCSMGSTFFAANKNDFLQKSTTGAFAAIGSAPVPKASICITVGPVSAPFVMVFDVDDGVNDYTDGWKNSALSNAATSAAASWTDGTGGASSGRLLDGLPGPITAAIAYRDGVIAWKPSGMYLGSYDTKLSAAWSWERISSDIGCIGKNCAIQFDDTIWFADANGIFLYDGSYPRRAPGYVHRWWSSAVAMNAGTAATRHLAKIIWDKKRRNLWFFLPVSGQNCMGLVHHVDSQKWMPWTSFVNAAASVTAQDIIAIENVSGSDGWMISDTKKPGILNFTAGSGNPAIAPVTFGVIGDNTSKTQMSGWRLAPLVATAASTAISAATVTTGDYWRTSTGVVGASATGSANGARLAIDVTAANRFLQPAVAFTAGADVEIAYQGGFINLQRSGDN